VQKYTGLFSKKWLETDFDAPALKKQDKRLRKRGQKTLDRGLDKVFALLDDFPEKEPEKKERADKLKAVIAVLARAHLDIKNKEFEKEMFDGIMGVTECFISRAREFDPEVRLMDIMQAMRNVWIMNILQMIAGKRPEYTPSIFAYSMLYPYTDNYLDSRDVSAADKKEFNSRLAQRIKGEAIKPENGLEEKAFALIHMIEGQYPRQEYPEVFESVLSILQGQTKSLSQQSGSVCGKNGILCISAEKGGTSVLADAYLVCGKLDENMFEFVFGYGFMLQLIDDLQDAAQDRKNRHITIFSGMEKGEKFDETANRLINFIVGALDYEKASGSPYVSDIKKMIIENCILMVFQAVAKNRKFFTKRYLAFARGHSAISLDYFAKMDRKIKRKMKELSGKGVL
jgi:hypothetical protein